MSKSKTKQSKESGIENLEKILEENNINKDIRDAILSIDRGLFFDPFFMEKMYGHEPIPVGSGEESDDLVLLAKMLQVLKPKKKWRVLEVGTGSGYSTAILASMVKNVVSVEYIEQLALSAKERVIDAGYFNVRFFAGDVTRLEVPLGKFDGIIIYPGCHQGPIALLSMLNEKGVAVFPMGPPHQQQITSFTNDKSHEWDAFSIQYKFHDFCQVDSIRGPYGWLDQQEGYLVDEAEVGPSMKPEEEKEGK
ncbi:MAG: methyltransferase domain-containing protein [bacterium]|nr:methyltransferase domain-containing protein [bacterium]